MRSFHNLSSYDFELLVRDLLTAEHGINYEVFSPGPDGGIDLRSTVGNRTTIVQCKHYLRSGRSDLERELALELPKLQSLKPSRYIVATTASITPARKQRLAELLHPFVKQAEDILGPEDIDGLLSRHQRVELANPKLWMATANVLTKLVHGAVSARTDALVARLGSSLKTYVRTPHLFAAKKALDSAGCCIIKGPAGAGKTTLAEAILADALAEGYEPIWVSAAVDEAFSLLARDRKQIVLYDDFLGHSTTAELLGKNEDTRLIELLELVKRSQGTRFITTTRDYILEHALNKHPRLREFIKSTPEVVLKLESYDLHARAHILYNHLFHSGLSQEALRLFRDADEVKRLLAHANFNPRLIATFPGMTKGQSVADQGPQAFRRYLDDPTQLWTSLMVSLPPATKTLLMVLATLPSDVDVVDFLNAASSYCIKTGTDSRELSSCVRTLDGTFIKTEGAEGRSYVDFLNHSVRDFAVRQLDALTGSEILTLCASAVYWEQAALLGTLAFTTEKKEFSRLLANVRTEAFAQAGALKGALQSQPGALTDAVVRTIPVAAVRRKATWSDPMGDLARLTVALSWGPVVSERLRQERPLAKFVASLEENPRPREVLWLAEACATSGPHARALAGGYVRKAVERSLRRLTPVTPELHPEDGPSGFAKLVEQGREVEEWARVADAVQLAGAARKRLNLLNEDVIGAIAGALRAVVGYATYAASRIERDPALSTNWHNEHLAEMPYIRLRKNAFSVHVADNPECYLPDPEGLHDLARLLAALLGRTTRGATADELRLIIAAHAIYDLSEGFLQRIEERGRERERERQRSDPPRTVSGQVRAEPDLVAALFGTLGDD